MNFGIIRIEEIFKVIRLDEISRGKNVDREKSQELSQMTPMFPDWLEDEALQRPRRGLDTAHFMSTCCSQCGILGDLCKN